MRVCLGPSNGSRVLSTSRV
ncbi:hypothetical protein MTR67_018348 [Solanum verrucosum]|uniref:Uncharacterized protein n=1 Tax=Solanum verrucosum TaxID=315347 RepID=A0AAF0QMB2_SOLVR|nr:hypothetical protein MTR67_018348 [Solanum verrucosum]